MDSNTIIFAFNVIFGSKSIRKVTINLIISGNVLIKRLRYQKVDVGGNVEPEQPRCRELSVYTKYPAKLTAGEKYCDRCQQR